VSHSAVFTSNVKCVHLVARRRTLKMCCHKSHLVLICLFSYYEFSPYSDSKNVWKFVNIWRNLGVRKWCHFWVNMFRKVLSTERGRMPVYTVSQWRHMHWPCGRLQMLLSIRIRRTQLWDTVLRREPTMSKQRNLLRRRALPLSYRLRWRRLLEQPMRRDHVLQWRAVCQRVLRLSNRFHRFNVWSCLSWPRLLLGKPISVFVRYMRHQQIPWTLQQCHGLSIL